MAGAAANANTSQAAIAQRNWEMANNVENISPIDEIYRYDKRQQQDILNTKLWEKEYV